MSRAPATTFTLSPDNPSNATIYDASGRALYTVATRRLWSGTTTVTIGKKPPVPLRNWLHTSLADLSANANVSVKDALGRKYKWRGYAPGYGGTTSTLELYTKDDNYAEPIARFDRPQQRYEAGTRYAGARTGAEPATLVLAGRALEIRDTVVISCLFLERARRKNESLEKSSAEALSTLPTLAVTYGWSR